MIKPAMANNAMMTEQEERLALADDYERGLKRALASGYEEFGPEWQRRHQLIIDALRSVPAQGAPSREAMAETIHKARWPADRQMAITPFADEDRNGREYCFRIADAVLATLTSSNAPAAQRTPMTDADRQWIIDLIHSEYDPKPSHYKPTDDWNDGTDEISKRVIERFGAAQRAPGTNETGYQLELLIVSVQDAVDLLAERKYGSPSRSAGHNARLLLETAMKKAVSALTSTDLRAPTERCDHSVSKSRGQKHCSSCGTAIPSTEQK